MKIGPKYKIAKRLGAPVFEKTQTQKFALSEARKTKMVRKRKGPASDYSKQLTEKQKMRYTYGITEKQLRRYVDEASTKSHQPVALLIGRLESRLDNVVYRLGLAKTRQAARQMVSHGHVLVNGRRLSIPSYRVRVSDKIAVREGSKTSGLFTEFEENHVGTGVPQWLTFDAKTMTGEKKSEPGYEPTEVLFDPDLVLEYYSR
jgi:small subunit ribosomal protein S4